MNINLDLFKNYHVTKELEFIQINHKCDPYLINIGRIFILGGDFNDKYQFLFPYFILKLNSGSELLIQLSTIDIGVVAIYSIQLYSDYQIEYEKILKIQCWLSYNSKSAEVLQGYITDNYNYILSIWKLLNYNFQSFY
jgi:hypothetical protein